MRLSRINLGPIHAIYAARLVSGAAFSSLMPFVLLHFTDNLRLSPAASGSVLGVQELMPVFTGVVAGWLVSRIGSRSMLGAALSLLALATWEWLSGLGGLSALWGSAVLSGIAFAAIRVGFSSTVADLVAKEEASHAFSMLHAFANIGFAVGPLLNSYWVSRQDYRHAFWVPITLYFVAAILILGGVPGDVGRVSRAEDQQFGFKRCLAEYGLGGMVFLGAILLVMFFNGIRLQADIVGLGKYFVDYFHSTRATSLYWTVQSIAVVIIVPFGGRLVKQWEVSSLFLGFVSGMALVAGGFWSLGFFGPEHLRPAFACLIVLTVLGECLAVPSFGSLLVTFLGKNRAGLAFGMTSTISALGMSVGASLGGVFLQRSIRLNALPGYWQLVGPICVGAFAAAFLLGYAALGAYQARPSSVGQEA